uniref:JmjC domain-containing protein n=1 Tax=Aplanochytrium stocchinoi TaxID=215587 RepID=A0A7S3PGZ2_9STRA
MGLGNPQEDLFAFGVSKQDFEAIEIAKSENRLQLIDGKELVEVLTGVWTCGNGAHTPGSQWILIQGSNKTLISLCVDSAYLYKNIEEMIPIGSCVSKSANLSAIKQMKTTADVLVPGHDLLICKQFRNFEQQTRVYIIDPGCNSSSIGELEKSINVHEKLGNSNFNPHWLKPVKEFEYYGNQENDIRGKSSWISDSELKEKFLDTNLPVVLRQVKSQKRCFDWDLNYLREKCENNIVIVRTETNRLLYRQGKRVPIEKMKFGRYATQILEKQKCRKRYYLAACNVKKALPQVNDEVYVPSFVKKIHKGPFLWVAPEEHYEFCHFDPDDGLLIVLSGKKTVRVFPPRYVDEMYPNPLGSYGRTIQSQVDKIGSVPDLDMYPEFRNVEGFETTLQTGDMLYIPAFWWHQVYIALSILPAITS